MTKKLLLLGGLAIAMVVLNHAALYGQLAIFEWAKAPTQNVLHSLPHYGLLLIRSLGVFTVPGFLFISGFFSVYLIRGTHLVGNQSGAVLRRVLGLVVPYLVWSTGIFLAKAAQGTVYRPIDYVSQLLTTGASSYLYFVPVLCSCYLLSPWIVKVARRQPRLLVCLSVLLLVAAVAAVYGRRFGVRSSLLSWLGRVTPCWSLAWSIIYFVLGSVTALHAETVKALLSRFRRVIAPVTLAIWLLHVLEWNALMQAGRASWTGGYDTLSSVLVALCALACFLAAPDLRLPLSKAFHELGKHTYGIYLVHQPVIGFAAYVIRSAAPWILVYQVLLLPLLFVVGLGFPLLAMEAVRRTSRSRSYYRFLFG